MGDNKEEILSHPSFVILSKRSNVEGSDASGTTKRLESLGLTAFRVRPNHGIRITRLILDKFGMTAL
jgi:hypothetical protein